MLNKLEKAHDKIPWPPPLLLPVILRSHLAELSAPHHPRFSLLLWRTHLQDSLPPWNLPLHFRRAEWTRSICITHIHLWEHRPHSSCPRSKHWYLGTKLLRMFRLQWKLQGTGDRSPNLEYLLITQWSGVCTGGPCSLDKLARPSVGCSAYLTFILKMRGLLQLMHDVCPDDDPWQPPARHAWDYWLFTRNSAYLLNHTLPQTISQLVFVHRRIPFLLVQMCWHKIIHFLPQVLVSWLKY